MEQPGLRPPSGIPAKDFERKDGAFSLEAITASRLHGSLAECGGERGPGVKKTHASML